MEVGDKVYSIFHKETNEMWVARSGKSSWLKVGHAKNAWAQGPGRNEVKDDRLVNPKIKNRWNNRYYFDIQDVYEIREMGSLVEGDKLEKAMNLLKDILYNYEAGEDVDDKIEKFLEER